MADSGNGAPITVAAGVEAKSVSATTDLYREMQQKRESHRTRRNKPHTTTPVDGTVSDSVIHPATSPRPKRQPKQRQSVAAGPASVQNGHTKKADGAKGRPVSIGGPMFPATPAKEQAYAGPTFQASPAPSSLPVPKFFSKSVPNVAAPIQARMEAEKTPERQDSSPEPDVVSPSVPREAAMSPLDLFFKADKQEKERSRSSGMLSPEMANRRPISAIEPRNSFLQSGTSNFLPEMDGNNEEMLSPRTVPPNKRPSPVERAHSSPGIRPADEEQNRAHTQSLKDLLFNMTSNTTQTQTPPQPRAQSDAQIFQTPSPAQRAASGASTPAHSTDQPDHYALHYGNRNLSPPFKAARNETPTRPSSLWQELPNGNTAPQPANGPPRHIPEIDSNSLSREYLNQQLPTTTKHAPLPVRNGTRNQAPQSAPPVRAPFVNPSGPSTTPNKAPRGVSNVASGSPSGNSGSRDIGSMEDDLRRILKLNA